MFDLFIVSFFFVSSRRRHTRWPRDWSSDVCSSDLVDDIDYIKDLHLEILTANFLTLRMMIYKSMLFATLSLCLTTLAAAQQHEVSGQVTEASTGESLAGVNISVEGTTIGTSTDSNGEFTLSGISPNANLVTSFIGYEEQVIPVSGRSVINIEIIYSEELLDEVVVTALGISRDRQIGRAHV